MSAKSPDQRASAPIPPATERRPYEPPRIVTREKLEIIAAACNPVTQKSFGDPGPCLTSTSS